MKNLRLFFVFGLLAGFVPTTARADYAKGMTMFQIYGGAAGLGGRYHQPGVNRDEQDLADGGGLIGGQFLYFTSDSWAVGVDISHASFGDKDSNQLLTNRLTDSSADNTSGLFVARLSYPRGRFRPYIQGGFGVHHTSVELTGVPFNGTTWADTGTAETRTLLDDGHLGMALEGSVGAYVYFTERFFIGAELKVLDLPGKDFQPTSAGLQEGLLAPNGAVSETGIGLMIGLGF
jgi:hypothetical protein